MTLTPFLYDLIEEMEDVTAKTSVSVPASENRTQQMRAVNTTRSLFQNNPIVEPKPEPLPEGQPEPVASEVSE